MKISKILKQDRVTISCEMFPPKKGSLLENHKETAEKMAALRPSYLSCTYGATGGTSDYTVEIAETINKCSVPAVAHLTCVSSTKEKVESVINELKERRIEKFWLCAEIFRKNPSFLFQSIFIMRQSLSMS